MKSMMRSVALMAALVMVLGWAQAMRPDVAAANEDVELLQPPTTKGDPDSGGPGRLFGFSWYSVRLSSQRFVSGLLAVISRRAPEHSQQSTVRTTTNRARSR
jgi:hypothetical protein